MNSLKGESFFVSTNTRLKCKLIPQLQIKRDDDDKFDVARRTCSQIHLRKWVIKYSMVIFDRAMHQIVARNVFRAKKSERRPGERQAEKRSKPKRMRLHIEGTVFFGALICKLICREVERPVFFSGYFIAPHRTIDTSADFAIMRADAHAFVKKSFNYRRIW